MTVEELIIYAKKYIHSIDAKMLLANILHYDTLELLTHLDEVVSEDNINLYKQEIEAFKNNKPLQYIIGTTNFYGYEFKVNENVLIPRFETEQLVENTIQWVKEHNPEEKGKLIDLGCGSGCIGITLKKKLPNLEVTCLDISDKALEIAKENAKNLEADLLFIQGDMLEKGLDSYDIVISNPPYISKDEEIDEMVRNNEPDIALFAEEEGTYYYHRLLENIQKLEQKPKLIAFEIGYLQKDKIFALAEKYLENYKIECKKDLAGKDRMIFIELMR